MAVGRLSREGGRDSIVTRAMAPRTCCVDIDSQKVKLRLNGTASPRVTR